MDFLTGVKVLEEVVSPINGKVRVLKSLGLGTYIQVENLTQSGGVVYGVWKSTLKKLKNSKNPKLKNCLILGLGGGSAAKLVRKFWPEASITGVDIDPVMVEMGKKHMGLTGVEIAISDAEKYLLTISHPPASHTRKRFGRGQPSNIKFDLILVDLYVGYEVPEKFQTENYIRLVRLNLERSGKAVFNRLYFGEKRAQAMKFAKKLEKVFSKVEYFYPEANVMFICSN